MQAMISAATMKPSMTMGNSAHSSGWLKPASTRIQPGITTAKFHRPNIHWPSRALVTGRPESSGTAWYRNAKKALPSQPNMMPWVWS